MTGNVIDVTAVGEPSDNGIMLFLSPDLRGTMQAAMDNNCAAGLNSACYDAVMDILEDSDNVLLESRSLERRDNGSSADLEKRILPLLGAGVIGLGGLLFPIFYKGDQHTVVQPLKIPATQIEDAFVLETATSIVVVTDLVEPTMVITAAPEQTDPIG